MKNTYVFKPEQQSKTDLFMGQVYTALKDHNYQVVSINKIEDKAHLSDNLLFRIELKEFDYLHRAASKAIRELGLEIIGFRVNAFSDFGKSTWLFVEERWPQAVPRDGFNSSETKEVRGDGFV